ncbi:hypothetical protein CVV38_00960 [Candidatus Peregrinibacteria bacterium HGW-Peregrinibacteria-1]|jgi:hypothetical protein|nr:MAG: hypothetical protein CVV38_00960 [Candidatus Peregrinibacteria bacterium HGW-Peregrinibacteria-1]
MPNWLLSGQEGVKERLVLDVVSNKVSHSYLFTGVSGKDGLAAGRFLFDLIKEHLGGEESDYREFLNNGEAFLKEQALELVRLANQTGQGYGNFIVVDGLERMNDSSFNILLKTLEEPPGNTCFVLTASSQDLVPETVVSRCRVIHFGNDSMDKAREVLVGEFNDENEETIETVVTFVNGNLENGRVLLGNKEKLKAFFEMRDFCLKLIGGMKFADKLQFAQGVKADGQTRLLLMVLLFVLRLDMVNSALGKGLGLFSASRLAFFVEAVVVALQDLDKNVNEGLVLDNVLLLFD